MTLNPDDLFRVDRLPGLTVYRRRRMPLNDALHLLDSPGELLKRSAKYETRRVGEWVVKSSRRDIGIEILKRTFRRNHYRHGWEAARHLERHNIGAPRPQAFVEMGRFGLITGNALISDYIIGQNVEQYADAIRSRGATDDHVRQYLSRLAGAITALCDSGAYHSDLSGKNILTQAGERFFFVDLDGVVLGRTYTDALRLRNHVQLYDSFRDKWDDGFLEPFIASLLSPAQNLADWMRSVRQAQARRRARTMAIWRKRGMPHP